MVRVGLTGGIASGKSVVSDRLGRLGAVVIDADVLAREVVEPGTTALAAIIGRFGDAVLIRDAGGGAALEPPALDRAALGRIVFDDPAARRDLEQIIHPAVRARAAEIESQAPLDAVVLHVIPLLVETGQQDGFDAVVVVDVDQGTQIQRLLARTPLTVEEAQARIAAQATREQRLAAADYRLDNNGTVEQLEKHVDDLWSKLSPTPLRK